jgi:hypothetical protein
MLGRARGGTKHQESLYQYHRCVQSYFSMGTRKVAVALLRAQKSLFSNCSLTTTTRGFVFLKSDSIASGNLYLWLKFAGKLPRSVVRAFPILPSSSSIASTAKFVLYPRVISVLSHNPLVKLELTYRHGSRNAIPRLRCLLDITSGHRVAVAWRDDYPAPRRSAPKVQSDKCMRRHRLNVY